MSNKVKKKLFVVSLTDRTVEKIISDCQFN